MSEAERQAAIADASRGFQDYRLAWWCLIVEEPFHRTYGDVVAAEGQIAAWIAKALPAEMQCGVTRAAFALASARQGNGYKITGLIELAYESIEPALAAVERLKPNPYAAGEILRLHASILLNDHGVLPAQARKRYEEAATVLALCDCHLAAKATVMMAEAERHEPGSAYFDTLARGIAGLDAFRDPRAKALGELNLLFYLVNERRLEEARRYQGIFAYPKPRLLRARRLAIDGCFEIAMNSLGLAEALLRRALEIFTGLGRRHDAVSIYLYLAYVRHELGDLAGCKDCTQSAWAIAKGLGLAQTSAIGGLLPRIGSEARVAILIVAEAAKAGGCLGPKAEAP
jgi:hypothetical protein